MAFQLKYLVTEMVVVLIEIKVGVLWYLIEE